MPNTFIDHRDRWLALSDVDYLGQFVKSWLAFNAWYRSAYTETQDRKILQEIKYQTNPIMNKFRPLLVARRDTGGRELPRTEESVRFCSDIGLLHHRLENYEIHAGKGDDKQRITFTNIYLKDNNPVSFTESKYGFSYELKRVANGNIDVQAKNATGSSVFAYTNTRYEMSHFIHAISTAPLSSTQRSYLQGFFPSLNPKLIADLRQGNLDAIQCGDHAFRCGEIELFSGVMEIIYQMRCVLFHGELHPSREASECYEPAYRIIRRFLESLG